MNTDIQTMTVLKRIVKFGTVLKIESIYDDGAFVITVTIPSIGYSLDETQFIINPDELEWLQNSAENLPPITKLIE
jgi:hypothetical protein